VEAGGCAAAVRDAADWRASPPGRAVGELVEWSPGPEGVRALGPAGELPASGVRVVDLTRVIAGPVGTRMLAALGAQVTRIADPRRPELPLLALDGGVGKTWLELDLREAAGRSALEDLLAGADVVVSGHRPGALAAFGLDPDALAARHPHLVCVTLAAWGTRGPWGTRRGFDSLVQAATGIALAVREDPPGALPVQALDHATGYLLAAAALRGLAERHVLGRAPRAALALAATARALLGAGSREPAPDRRPDPGPHLVVRGRLRVAAPPGSLDGRPLAWP
jgi:crotonobetainyl-CoA:carnitine CoA-transferase CaiB-like acyl-CoA transferase